MLHLKHILFLGKHPDSDQLPGSSYIPPENPPNSENDDEEEYIFYPPGTWHEDALIPAHLSLVA